MTIDWKEEVTKRKDNLLNDLISMLKIKSVYDPHNATSTMPLGPNIKKGLDQFLAIATRDGFTTKNIDNIVGEISYGKGDETLGILSHVDVVPAGDGWDSDPFKPVIKNDNIYARGASDDKGPAIACYYGLKIIKELGLPVHKKVAFIVGTDEEGSWRGMDYYFKHMPMPDFGFSPDAEFPIINGEKGNISFDAKFGNVSEGKYQLTKFKAGLRENMVPRDAMAWIKADDYKEIIQKFDEFIAVNPVVGSADIQDDQLFIHVIGKAAHAQEPKDGINAGTYLTTFLNQFDIQGDAHDFIAFIAEKLHLDSRCNNFDMAYSDKVMGDLTVNPGLMNFDKENGGIVTLNFRYPEGIGPDYIANGLDKVQDHYGIKFIKHTNGMIPHYVASDDPLVKTLLNVYHEQTDEPAYTHVVGGGTYGRLMKRGVAYGALFPNVPNVMHQPNEFMPVENIMKAAAIYAQAIYELIK